MADTTNETEDTKLKPRTAVLVRVEEDDDTSTAVGIIDEGSLSTPKNEDNEDFERMGSTRVDTDPTTENPKIEVTAARAVGGGDTAREEFGFIDDEGNYQRDEGRTWHSCEIWWYEHEAEGEPDEADRYEDVRWDIDTGQDRDGKNAILYDVVGESAAKYRKMSHRRHPHKVIV